MGKIEFIDHMGQSTVVEAENGRSIMETAVRNGIQGIQADCGGACSCATCHCYVGDDWFSKVGAAEGDEEGMLEFAFEVKNTSRLSCQIKMSEQLDGIKIYLPSQQG
ncbi:MAG: 2Fe-2S iron-sulfur cluster-binding protein [Acinetobacter sp.]